MFFLDKLKKYDIILASKSQRRRQLLKECLIPFRVVTLEIEERRILTDSPEDIVIALCKAKASAYEKVISNENYLLITADTIVYQNGMVLNKPSTKYESLEMLKRLSGKTHCVYTGVCIKNPNKEKAFYEKTTVLFENLTSEEIEFYSYNYKPFDKAGGYGIQEWIGLIGVNRIEGNYHNVVGLPVARLIKELKEFIE